MSLLKQVKPQKEPRSLLLISKPKVGKTTICSTLPHSVLIDMEDGSNYISHDAVLKVDDKTNWSELLKVKGEYHFCIVDTLSALESYFDSKLTKEHNRKVIAEAKSSGADKDANTVSSITALPFGAGYGELRVKIVSFMKFIESIFPRVIYLGHSRNKLINSNATVLELALSGKLMGIVLSLVDTIGYLHKDNENKVSIVFNSASIDVGGSRFDYGVDELPISKQLEDGSIETYWEDVFPESIKQLINAKEKQ